MTGLTRDDVRAAVGAGMITEAQAASLVALSESRRGVRERLDGRDEPFELFRGFNEIFIVVGLGILYSGWIGLSALASVVPGQVQGPSVVFGLIGLAVIAALSWYFTRKRRMVAPSIALVIFTAISAGQMGTGIAALADADTDLTFLIVAVTVAIGQIGHYLVLRVPFSTALIALSLYAVVFGQLARNAGLPENVDEIFLLTGGGIFALTTVALGLIGFVLAMAFDFSDPHRVTRRNRAAFWLHIVSAPAIVNPVAQTLLAVESAPAQIGLLGFVLAIGLLAIVIDRRSFLVAGVAYIVALAFTVFEGNGFAVILCLGVILVLLGAYWERLRARLMEALPRFPGKDKLPPWTLIAPSTALDETSRP